MKLIKLVNGGETVVDDEVFEKLKHFKWRKNKDGYVVYREKGNSIFLHRLIKNTPEGLQTDHRNGNRLDNLNDNLRIVNDSLNKFNMGIRSDNTSGYKGVYYRKDRKIWSAEIKKDGKKYRLGCYKSKDDAGRAYNKMALELFGEYARLNEIN